jgi:permease yjgP/yjgQ
VLHDVVEETVPTLPKESRAQTQARVERKVMKSMVWGKSLDGNIFGLLMIKPEDMSLQELHYYIEYLKENGQTYKRFDTAFWSKAFYPLAILVMLLLSMPFAYQNARAGGMAIKIFCGIMIGIFYYALNNLFAFMSALDSVPSIISAILPSVMMTLAAIIAMWYVERRS